MGRSHGPHPPGPPAEKALTASDQRRQPSATPRLCLQKTGNGVPPGINILMKKPRGLCSVAFWGFLYPLLNIGFGRPAKVPFPCDPSLCKFMTIPAVFTSCKFSVNKQSGKVAPSGMAHQCPQTCLVSHRMANETPLMSKTSWNCACL